MKKTQLTLKQQAFVEAYLQHGNGSEAYRKAFPAALKWKPHTVAEHASRLLARGNIRAIIQTLRERSQSAAVATRQEVLELLTRVIRACPTDLLDEHGYIDLKKLKACRQELAALDIEDTAIGHKYKAKFLDPLKAADQLAKLQGWNAPEKIASLEVKDITIRIV
jgi:phage terminase small subunit